MFSFLFLQYSFLRNTNTYNCSSFLFVCLLFRRCSLSFRNLLSCHTVSRVCYCQSHSNEQSANIVYRIFRMFGCSLGYGLRVFQMDTVYNRTVKNNTSSPTQTIHPSIHPSVYLSRLPKTTIQQPTVDKSDDRLVIRIFQNLYLS